MDYPGQLAPIGSWKNGYRPTKIRVTTEGAPAVSLKLYDEAGATIAYDIDYFSGKEVDIYPSDNDIGRLYIGGFGNQEYFHIINIEFYPAP